MRGVPGGAHGADDGAAHTADGGAHIQADWLDVREREGERMRDGVNALENALFAELSALVTP